MAPGQARRGPEDVFPPPAVPLRSYAACMQADPQDERSIREYVLNESPAGEVVKSAEKVHTEHVASDTYDVWDVRTRRQRWWVITNPTNLYLQREHPSMDNVITFHIGLMHRVLARQRPWGTPEEQDRTAEAWRRWQQASDSIDEAGEAEDFQTIGLRCREALLAFASEMAVPAMVPEGQVAPKKADFIHWSQLIADYVAPGPSNERVRGYLKDLAKAIWELANWLTHAKNAVKMDARLASEGTGHTLFAFDMAMIRKESRMPDCCPECGSRRLKRDWRPEFGPEHENVTRCEACNWLDLPPGVAPDWELVPEHIRAAIT